VRSSRGSSSLGGSHHTQPRPPARAVTISSWCICVCSDPKDAWFTPENKELCKAPVNALEKTASTAYEHWWTYMHYNTHSMKTLLETLLKTSDGKLEGALKSLHLTKAPLDKDAPPKHATALLSAALAAHKGAERTSGQLEGAKEYADEKDHRAVPLNSFISLWSE